jgi:hypothetical protein
VTWAVMLPRSGSTSDLSVRSFAAALAGIGVELVAPWPLVFGGISLGAHVAARWALRAPQDGWPGCCSHCRWGLRRWWTTLCTRWARRGGGTRHCQIGAADDPDGDLRGGPPGAPARDRACVTARRRVACVTGVRGRGWAGPRAPMRRLKAGARRSRAIVPSRGFVVVSGWAAVPCGFTCPPPARVPALFEEVGR